jgi:hypothetical protein
MMFFNITKRIVYQIHYLLNLFSPLKNFYGFIKYDKLGH